VSFTTATTSGGAEKLTPAGFWVGTAGIVAEVTIVLLVFALNLP